MHNNTKISDITNKALHIEAISFANDGNYEKALEWLNYLLTKEELDCELKKEIKKSKAITLANMDEENCGESLHLFDELLEEDNNLSKEEEQDLLYRKGIAYSNLEKYEDAIKIFDELIKEGIEDLGLEKKVRKSKLKNKVIKDQLDKTKFLDLTYLLVSCVLYEKHKQQQRFAVSDITLADNELEINNEKIRVMVKCKEDHKLYTVFISKENGSCNRLKLSDYEYNIKFTGDGLDGKKMSGFDWKISEEKSNDGNLVISESLPILSEKIKKISLLIGLKKNK